MTCRRLEDEEMLADLGDTLHEHAEECPDCSVRLRRYRAIAELVATNSPAHELPLGWKDRVMARMSTSRAGLDQIGDSISWSLLVQHEDSILRFPLPASGVITIGSATDVELRLADPLVSPRHACVIANRGRYQILDLNGQAECSVNGETLATVRRLSNYDLIKIGDTRLWLEERPTNQHQASDIESEAAFYKQLLTLGSYTEIEPLLAKALSLIVEAAHASVGYIEIHELGGQPRFWQGHAATGLDVALIRATLSHGSIVRALDEGRTIETPNVHAQISDAGTTYLGEAHVVLCAPVGFDPRIGVVYLGRRTRDGEFSATDRVRVELFARQLALLADRSVGRDANRIDYTQRVREKFRCEEIVGRSQALARLLEAAARISPLDVCVLMTGAYGTGKSLLARVIVKNSARATKGFVDLNCAALPATLIESELFGAERGALSMDSHRVAGKVALAEGGTLFLDEVGELTLGAQAKLVHFLSTREYTPRGATSAIRADVRVIAATNVNLKERVAARQFREDLFYRLHVIPLEVPGLEARRDDIPELVEHFCLEACKRHELPMMALSRRALTACEAVAWPGHLRQLSSAIEAAVIRAHSEGSVALYEHHVFPKADSLVSAADVPTTLQQATREFLRRHVLAVLEKNDWSVIETARELDLAVSHLYNLIKAFDLKRD